LPPESASVPENLPFVLEVDPVRHLLRHGGAEFVLSLLVGAAMLGLGGWLLGVADPTVHSTRYGDVPTPWVAWASMGIGVYLLIGVPITIMSRGRGRPVLGADRQGLHLRPNLDPKRALYLPWAEIAWIAVRHHQGPQLCVKPVDSGVETAFAERGGSLGARIARNRRLSRLGTTIAVPIGGAARDVDDVVAALRAWSAGAVRVDVG
jgi:hypothetical protein